MYRDRWNYIVECHPRFDRFLPPGLRLTQEKHPKLFEQIASVAQAANQRSPKEVYLILM